MLDPDPKKGQALKMVLLEAEKMRSDGVPVELIKDTLKEKLLAQGFSAAAAEIIAGTLPGTREVADGASSGKKCLIGGGVLFLCGMFFSSLADTFGIVKSGGYYFIVLGAMLLGMGIFIAGVLQLKSRI